MLSKHRAIWLLIQTHFALLHLFAHLTENLHSWSKGNSLEYFFPFFTQLSSGGFSFNFYFQFYNQETASTRMVFEINKKLAYTAHVINFFKFSNNHKQILMIWTQYIFVPRQFINKTLPKQSFSLQNSLAFNQTSYTHVHTYTTHLFQS